MSELTQYQPLLLCGRCKVTMQFINNATQSSGINVKRCQKHQEQQNA